MAGSLSDLAEVEILKIVTGQSTAGGTQIWTVTPVIPYVALFTGTPPTDAGGGTEATGANYARITTSGKWGAPAAGSVSNNAIISFLTFNGSISGNAPFTAFGLFNALTAGILLAWGTLTDQTKTGGSGDTVSFAVGALTITCD